MAFRTCNISARAVFLFNIITVLVLVTYLVDLEKKIANAKDSSEHDSSLLNNQVNGNSVEKVHHHPAIQAIFFRCITV